MVRGGILGVERGLTLTPSIAGSKEIDLLLDCNEARSCRRSVMKLRTLIRTTTPGISVFLSDGNIARVFCKWNGECNRQRGGREEATTYAACGDFIMFSTNHLDLPSQSYKAMNIFLLVL